MKWQAPRAPAAVLGAAPRAAARAPRRPAWPTAPARQPRRRGCPACGLGLERIARQLLDRLLSWAMPVKRYRCAAAACAWEGVLLSRARPQPRPGAAGRSRRR